ncbi:MAG TPA: response regulator [Bacteroidia bacterium]|nr:response regulator [Bacteroidia bacterium]
MNHPASDAAILYIDDETKSLKYFEAIFGHLGPIYTASSAAEGFALFRQHHARIGVVVSDKQMPGASGLDLLAKIRDFDPNPLRFLVTAFSNLDTAVDLLNDGLLYSYLTKPWDPADLEHRLGKALAHYRLERERESLIREKSSAFQHLLMADKAASIGILSSGLNHHLRNALTVMRTFYDLLPYQLEEELGGQPKDQAFWGEFYHAVGGQIERMTSILTNLSEGTRMNDLRLSREISLRSVFLAACDVVLEESPGIRVWIDEEAGVPMIEGDLSKLSQMARFLFEESRAMLGGEGEIEVRIGKVPGREAVETRFIDSGLPVPESDLERLFDPFYVRASKPGELGTNLMACYLTVFHHGGTIRAERTADGRNSIVFTLPVVSAAVEQEESEISAGQLWRLTDCNRHEMRPAGAALSS